jgi:hypothetical protein
MQWRRLWWTVASPARSAEWACLLMLNCSGAGNLCESERLCVKALSVASLPGPLCVLDSLFAVPSLKFEFSIGCTPIYLNPNDNSRELASVYPDAPLLDIAYVSHIRYKCFILMLRMFYNCFKCFFRCFCKCFKCMFLVFNLSSDVCCKYCIWMFQK